MSTDSAVDVVACLLATSHHRVISSRTLSKHIPLISHSSGWVRGRRRLPAT